MPPSPFPSPLFKSQFYGNTGKNGLKKKGGGLRFCTPSAGGTSPAAGRSWGGGLSTPLGLFFGGLPEHGAVQVGKAGVQAQFPVGVVGDPGFLPAGVRQAPGKGRKGCEWGF